MLFARVCAALLLCGYCAVSVLADRAECPDFSNIDFCEDEDNDFDPLQVSFGECDAIVNPHNARHEPVVKYNDAEEVNSCICAKFPLVIKRFMCHCRFKHCCCGNHMVRSSSKCSRSVQDLVMTFCNI